MQGNCNATSFVTVDLQLIGYGTRLKNVFRVHLFKILFII